MNISEINTYREHFKKYTDSFLGSDKYKNKNYKLKKDHTERVSTNILYICNALDFSDSEKNIAEAIAIYHDIGRFSQFETYNTFNDKRSVNHALLGINVLKKEKILDRSDHKDIIYSAIMSHNIKTLPDNIKNNRKLIYSKLIRDADKLDILRVLSNYYTQKQNNNPALDLDLPDNDRYTQLVLDEFFSNKCVDTKHIRSALDYKILQLSWIYDINFKSTLLKIKDEKYLEKIMSVLPSNSITENIYSHIYEKMN